MEKIIYIEHLGYIPEDSFDELTNAGILISFRKRGYRAQNSYGGQEIVQYIAVLSLSFSTDLLNDIFKDAIKPLVISTIVALWKKVKQLEPYKLSQSKRELRQPCISVTIPISEDWVSELKVHDASEEVQTNLINQFFSLVSMQQQHRHKENMLREKNDLIKMQQQHRQEENTLREKNDFTIEIKKIYKPDRREKE